MPQETLRLCDICTDFDVRALLLAAEKARQKPNTNRQGLLTSSKHGTIRQAIPAFFKHQSSALCLKAAAADCDLCGTIWREYGRNRPPNDLFDDALTRGLSKEQIYLGTLDWDTGSTAILNVVATQRGPLFGDRWGGSGQRQLACFEACVPHGDYFNDHQLLARVQASSSASDQCSDLARRWLNDCKEHHPSCRSAWKESLHRPTRLLRIGSTTGSTSGNDPLVQLVQGESCFGPYTALSYCWGPDRDLTLTEHTEPGLRTGQSSADFPPALRDAITVTRKLGVEFIWIDALCIFQDQDRQQARDDWALEAGRMRDVYRGAVLTIEAGSSTRARQGFLIERVSSKPYCALPWVDVDVTSLVYLRPVLDITDNQLLGTEIFTRGWALQERLLAPRTLSFGKQQMSFECANGFVDEAGRSSMLPRATEFYLSKKTILQLSHHRGSFAYWSRAIVRSLGLSFVLNLYNARWFSQGSIDVPGGWKVTYHEYWHGVVERYTERKLTNVTDRLAALSGLADEFQRATGDTYLAGHWKDELVDSLAWEYFGLELSGSEPNDWAPPPLRLSSCRQIAPSWSWASVEGRVLFRGSRSIGLTRVITTIARLEDIFAQPRDGTDPLDSMPRCSLLLRAPLLRISDPRHERSQYSGQRALHAMLHRKFTRPDSSDEMVQHHEHHEGQHFALLKLLQDESGRDQSPPEGIFFIVLLLESCPQGGYRRLSCVNINMSTPKEFEEQRLRQEWTNGPVSAQDLRYFEEHLRPGYSELEAIAEATRAANWQWQTVVLH